jgi:hypothetical protein
MNELIQPVEPTLCPICGNKPNRFVPDDSFPEWHCPRCGIFDYDRSTGWQKVNSPDEMVRLSGWVREQNAAGLPRLRITKESAARVFRRPLPRLRERSERLLAELARQYPRTGLEFENTVTLDLGLQGISYSRDANEVRLLINILEDNQFIAQMGSPHSPYSSLTVKGLLAAEALGANGSSSPQGFVAMWFDDSMSDAWLNGFEPGIRNAGYRPRRIDTKDYVGGVSDEIMAEIRRSRFVVADYTGQRNGVYFEAGFAAGLGLTIIPTCRSNEIANLHFDIKHLNTLVWKSPAELADTLARRIRAVIGAGPDAIDRL